MLEVMLYYIHQTNQLDSFHELFTYQITGERTMQNTIVSRIIDGHKAVITHWDHFHVDRATGSTITRAFTIKYLTGDKEGNSYVWPIRSLHQQFHIVGRNEVANVEAS